MISSIKSYGFLILSGLVGFLGLLLKLSRAKSERMERDRDIYKAKAEHHHKVAVEQKKVRQKHKRRVAEVTKDEETMDDRLSNSDNWSDSVRDKSSDST